MESNPGSSTNAKKNEKINKVLQKFLDPNFKLKNDVYLNLFLTHLFGKPSEEKKLTTEQKDQYSQWLIQACTLWAQSQIGPPSTILAFSLNFARHLSTDQDSFSKLDNEKVYDCLIGFAKTNLENDASVTLGWITLIYSFLEHNIGVQWILTSRYWSDIVIMGRDAHTMYIRNKAYQFVAKLLGKTIKINKNFCFNLIRILVKPLYDTLNTPNQPAVIENTVLFESVKPHLMFVSEVLEILLKDTQNKVLHLFNELRTVSLVEKLQMLSQIEDFSYELVKIRCIFLFANLGIEESRNVTHVTQDSIAFSDLKKMFDIIEAEMNKNHLRCVIKISYYAHNLYSNLLGKIPLCIRKGEPIEFQHQMIMFQILPMMVYMSESQGVTVEMVMQDTFKREFVSKLVKMAAIRTIEMCYRWKERLLLKPGIVDDMTFALQYILKAKPIINKEQAGIFFQPLVYTFKDLVKMLDANIKLDASFVNFTHSLMETIIDLVQSFDITWKESIETISVMDTACDFLKHQQLEQKLVVSALRVVNLALSKYMSAEMALLLDNLKDSAVSRTGSLLYGKCHDVSWEVRDTALECVCTLSLNANFKFPSFTDILLEAELPQLVTQMALYDGEYYVRSTAFKCLQEMIQIQQLWNVFKGMDNFLDKILKVFETETEGVARKEAAALVYRIYKHQSFPDEMLPRLYDIMTHAVTGDLYWEVKCNALSFWFEVFEKHLNDQGMVDRIFPPVIFSKEQKKIVTMTEEEVRKRVVKALNQLASVGCLYVIKAACLDECDVEVSKKCLCLVREVAKAFKKLKITGENLDKDHSNIESFVPSPSTSTTCPVYVDINSPGFLSSIFDSVLSPSPVSPSPSLNMNFMSPDSPILPITSNPGDSGPDLQCSEQNLCKTDKEPTKFDSLKADVMLDDLLSCNDMSFLEQIYNPSDQIQTANSQRHKRQYLAPSEFFKLIFDLSKLSESDRNQWLSNLDEFDSLLDDILKEYNIVPDVNSMDCY